MCGGGGGVCVCVGGGDVCVRVCVHKHILNTN